MDRDRLDSMEDTLDILVDRVVDFVDIRDNEDKLVSVDKVVVEETRELVAVAVLVLGVDLREQDCFQVVLK